MASIMSRTQSAKGRPTPLAVATSLPTPTGTTVSVSDGRHEEHEGAAMTAVEARTGGGSGAGSESGSQTGTTTATTGSSRVLHAHRQSHSGSKLPAYRFADRGATGSRASMIAIPGGGIPTAAGAVSRSRAGTSSSSGRGGVADISVNTNTSTAGGTNGAGSGSTKHNNDNGANGGLITGLPASVLQKHIPPSPVSPSPGESQDLQGETQDQSGGRRGGGFVQGSSISSSFGLARSKSQKQQNNRTSRLLNSSTSLSALRYQQNSSTTQEQSGRRSRQQQQLQLTHPTGATNTDSVSSNNVGPGTNIITVTPHTPEKIDFKQHLSQHSQNDDLPLPFSPPAGQSQFGHQFTTKNTSNTSSTIARSRASTFQIHPPTTTNPSSAIRKPSSTRRPVSCPDSPSSKNIPIINNNDPSERHNGQRLHDKIVADKITNSTATIHSNTRLQHNPIIPETTARQPPPITTAAPTSSLPLSEQDRQRLFLQQKQQETATSPSSPPSSTSATREWARGQRELLLPKSIRTNRDEEAEQADQEGEGNLGRTRRKPSLSTTAPAPTPHRQNTDERRASRRPPVSFKAPPGTAGTPAFTSSNTSPSSGKPVIPPIRAFRSSGSRRSLVLDMNTRSARPYDFGDEDLDSGHRDRTLRALEGRYEDDRHQQQQPTPPDSGSREGRTGDDGGDMFLRIARDEFARKSSDEPREGSTVSRATRSSHTRRPYSAAVPTYPATSPPRITRRLSDQQETKRSRNYDDDTQSVNTVSRPSAYRETMDRLADHGRGKPPPSALKSNPVTPRALTFQEGGPDSPGYHRRRGSIPDNAHPPGRAQYKTYSKPYNPSPLVPRHEAQAPDMSHGFESSESTASANPPSVMWDEVDKMKSQIERIQRKGTMPASSAISRVSDDRPPTATTNATTMSGSPKRTSGNTAHQTDATSTTSSHLRDPHPILYAALSKTKTVVTPEVFRALEVATHDAMSLAHMMGSAGQPGPISSGASSIGNGNGASVTDRQLRRKADGICRSLTELCIALTDSTAHHNKSPPILQTIETSIEQDTLASPTAPTHQLSVAPSVRRPSAAVDPPAHLSSPRGVSRMEERRNNLMGGSVLPSPRFPPNAPTEAHGGAGRKSSLFISRTRRAGTEEPDDGRRSSLLLRTRRAGTEEPEEGRKSSLLVRSRRNTLGDDDEEVRAYRAPSRVNPELARREREYAPAPPPHGDPHLAASALPRRRLVPSTLGASSRLAAPTTTPTTSRRYLDRTTPDREGVNMADRTGEDRGQRQYARPATTLLGRSGSLSRRPNRDSTIPGLSTQSAVNGYR